MRERAIRRRLTRRGLGLVALFGLPGLGLVFTTFPLCLFGAAVAGIAICLLLLVLRARRPTGASLPDDVSALPIRILPPRRLALVLVLMYGLTVVAMVAGLAEAFVHPDRSSDRRAGALFALVLLTVPGAMRLAVGGRERWRIELDREGFRYRGGRREEFLAWRTLRDVDLDEDATHLVLSQDKRRRRDVSVPILGFDVRPEQLVKLVWAAREMARRR